MGMGMGMDPFGDPFGDPMMGGDPFGPPGMGLEAGEDQSSNLTTMAHLKVTSSNHKTSLFLIHLEDRMALDHHQKDLKME